MWLGCDDDDGGGRIGSAVVCSRGDGAGWDLYSKCKSGEIRVDVEIVVER